jgi:hypothetical protein
MTSVETDVVDIVMTKDRGSARFSERRAWTFFSRLGQYFGQENRPRSVQIFEGANLS